VIFILGYGGHAIRIRSCFLACHLRTPLRDRQLRLDFDETVRAKVL
jgi:hypothetical protein